MLVNELTDYMTGAVFAPDPAGEKPMSGSDTKTMTVFYDSMCPVCSFEIDMLKRKDVNQAIEFTDITRPDFDPGPFGLTMDQLVGSIHGLNASGQIVSGMELFRQVYRALGMGWVWGWTAWPGVRNLADAGYSVFARIRPRFSRFRPQCNDSCRIG
jgi:predicted DCC family thiol-disulfide oxidoreductase YuxK